MKALLLLVVLGAGLAPVALAAPEPMDGPCLVKLRSGRRLEAVACQPVDERAAFWRIDLAGGGAVVLPVRELRAVEALAREPEPADVAGVVPPPEPFDGDVVRGCDPLSSAAVSRWDGITAEAADRHGVDQHLVKAVIAVESCGNPDAVSPKGAVGLMQLMPATAKDYGCVDRRDPRANVDAGVRHLARLAERLRDLELVLAAYNAGEGAVAKAGGIPRFRETRAYVRDVKRHLARLSGARVTATM